MMEDIRTIDIGAFRRGFPALLKSAGEGGLEAIDFGSNAVARNNGFPVRTKVYPGENGDVVIEWSDGDGSIHRSPIDIHVACAYAFDALNPPWPIP